MSTIIDIQKQTSTLSLEDKKGLLAFLINDLSRIIGPDDAEVLKRETEMDSGEVEPISHEEFLSQMGKSR